MTPGLSPRTERAQTQQRRKDIVQKAATYWVTHSFVYTSVEEIGNLVAVSRGALVSTYFPATVSLSTKEHLLQDVLNWITAQVDLQFTALNTLPPTKNLTEWGLTILHEMKQCLQTCPEMTLPFLIQAEYGGQHSLIDKKLQRYYAQWHTQLACFFHYIFDQQRTLIYTDLVLAMVQGASIMHRHGDVNKMWDAMFDRLSADWEYGTKYNSPVE